MGHSYYAAHFHVTFTEYLTHNLHKWKSNIFVFFYRNYHNYIYFKLVQLFTFELMMQLLACVLFSEKIKN